jgi:hypothetical protein
MWSVASAVLCLDVDEPPKPEDAPLSATSAISGFDFLKISVPLCLCGELVVIHSQRLCVSAVTFTCLNSTLLESRS